MKGNRRCSTVPEQKPLLRVSDQPGISSQKATVFTGLWCGGVALSAPRMPAAVAGAVRGRWCWWAVGGAGVDPR